MRPSPTLGQDHSRGLRLMKATWKPEGFFPLSNRNLRVGISQAIVLNQASWRPGRERQGHWLKACVSGYLPAPEPPGKKGRVSVAQSCPTLCNPMNCSPPGSSVHGISQARNTGVGCHPLLQGIFPTRGSNPVLLHCRQILNRLSHQEFLSFFLKIGVFMAVLGLHC